MGRVRPPQYRECPMCQREFGSRSLDIHVKRCPMKPPDHSTDTEIETSLSDDLSNSWPNKKKFYRRRKGNGGGGSSSQYSASSGRRRPRLQRPRTAVLKRPAVLDESLKDKLDMTLTKKQFLAAVKLVKTKMAFRAGQEAFVPRRNKMAAVGYRSRSRSNSRAGLGSMRRAKASKQELAHVHPTKIPIRQLAGGGEVSNGKHLRRITANAAATTKDLPDLAKNDAPKSRRRKKRDGATTSSSESVAEPCRTCGRIDFPERFHTHLSSAMSSATNLREERESRSGAAPAAAALRINSPPKRMESFEQRQQRNNQKKKKKPAPPPPPAASPVKNSSNLRSIYGSSSSSSSSPVKQQHQQQRQQQHQQQSDKSKSDSEDNKGRYHSNSDSTTSPSRRRRVPLKLGGDISYLRDAKGRSKEKVGIGEDGNSPDSDDNQESSSSNASNGSTGSTVNAVTKQQPVPPISSSSTQQQQKCSICGKVLERNNLFHERQCRRQQEIQERKAREEATLERQSRRTYFAIREDQGGGGGAEDDSLDEIWNAHVQQLIACDLCARTFFPDRIGRHRATCLGMQSHVSNKDSVDGVADGAVTALPTLPGSLSNNGNDMRRPPRPTILPPTMRGAKSGIKHVLHDLGDRVNHERRPQHRDPVAALEEELLAEEAAATAEAILAAAARAE